SRAIAALPNGDIASTRSVAMAAHPSAPTPRIPNQPDPSPSAARSFRATFTHCAKFIQSGDELAVGRIVDDAGLPGLRRKFLVACGVRMPPTEKASSTSSSSRAPKAAPTTRNSAVLEVFTTGELLRVLRAFRKGDFTVRLRPDYSGVAGEIA